MDRIQLRRDISARWAEINPILLEGEVGYEIDTKLRKIGDGVHRWNDLEYLRAEGISQETGNSENAVMSQAAVTRELSELGSDVGKHKIDISFESSASNQYVEIGGSRDISVYGCCVVKVSEVTGSYSDGDNGWRIEAVRNGETSYYTLSPDNEFVIKDANIIRVYLRGNSGVGSLKAVIESGLSYKVIENRKYTDQFIVFNANVAKYGGATTAEITLAEAIAMAKEQGLNNIARIICYYDGKGAKVAIFNASEIISGFDNVNNWKVLDWDGDLEKLNNLTMKLVGKVDSIPFSRTEQLYDDSNRDIYWKMRMRTGILDFQSGIAGMTLCIEINGVVGDTYSMAIIDDKTLEELGLQRNIVFGCGNNKPSNGVSYLQYATEVGYTDKYSTITLENESKYLFLNLQATDDSSVNSYNEVLSKLVIVKSSEVPKKYINPYEFVVTDEYLSEDILQAIKEGQDAVKKQQGSSNRGRFLIVGEDGNVTLGDRTESEGISNVIAEDLKTIYLKDNLSNTEAAFDKGVNWSGDILSGYTHNVGSEGNLIVSLGLDIGKRYILTYDSDKKGENIDVTSSLRIDINEQTDIDPYDDTYSPVIGFIASVSSTKITFKAGSNYAVTLRNISVYEITDKEHSSSQIVVSTKNIDSGSMKDNITGFWNVALGAFDALNLNQSGSRNIAIGHSSLQHLKTGTRNVCLGTFAGMLLEQGERNIAIGADSLYQIKKGNDNISIGKASMGNKTDAIDNNRNIAIGTQALLGNIEGTYDNVAIGYRALASQPSCNNVAIGTQAGYWLRHSGNVVIGNKAQSVVYVTGYDNTIIGAESRIYASGGTSDNPKRIDNAIAIGKGVTAGKSNEIVIGNNSNNLDYVVIGNKKIIFNSDGTCTWESI